MHEMCPSQERKKDHTHVNDSRSQTPSPTNQTELLMLTSVTKESIFYALGKRARMEK